MEILNNSWRKSNFINIADNEFDENSIEKKIKVNNLEQTIYLCLHHFYFPT